MGREENDRARLTSLKSKLNVSLENLRCLEVGGAVSESVLEDFDINYWTAVEYFGYKDNQYKKYTSGKYSYFSYGIEAYLQNHNDLFDLIVSYDAFEHITGLRNILLGLCERLNRGGLIYSYFAPIWEATNGHHSNELASLNAPDYIHLDIRPEELFIYLKNKHLMNDLDAYRLVDNVHHDASLNRYTMNDYSMIFEG